MSTDAPLAINELAHGYIAGFAGPVWIGAM